MAASPEVIIIIITSIVLNIIDIIMIIISMIINIIIMIIIIFTMMMMIILTIISLRKAQYFKKCGEKSS